MKKVKLWNIFYVSLGILFYIYKYILGIFLYRGLEFEAIKAILVSESVFFVITSVLMGICAGIGMLLAKCIKENKIEYKTLIRKGFCFTILFSAVVTVISIISKKFFFRMLIDSVLLIEYMLLYFEKLLIALIFTVLFFYIMVVIGTLGDFKTPCFFIVVSTLLEFGITRLVIYISETEYGMQNVVMAKVFLQIVMFCVACIYFLIKYANKDCETENTKLDWNIGRCFIKKGTITAILGLLTSMVIFAESMRFIQTQVYFYSYLLLGTLLVTPFIAGYIVKRYSANGEE